MVGRAVSRVERGGSDCFRAEAPNQARRDKIPAFRRLFRMARHRRHNMDFDMDFSPLAAAAGPCGARGLSYMRRSVAHREVLILGGLEPGAVWAQPTCRKKKG